MARRTFALLLLPLLWACAAAQPLSRLEQWAWDAAPSQRLGQLQTLALQQRREAIGADTGVRLVAGAEASAAREAVTDTLARDYRRGSVRVGLRWSLLAAGRERERALVEQQLAETAARGRQAQEWETVRAQLHGAYLEALFASERLALSRAFLRGEGVARRWLVRRTRAALLLESDRLAFVSMFDQAAQEALRQEQSAAQSVALLRRLTGRPLEHFAPEMPVLDERCLSLDAALSAAADHATVAQAAAELQARRLQSQQAQALDAEVGISATQSLSRDAAGPAGRATAVGLDFSMPLAAPAMRDARRAEAQAALAHAELAWRNRLDEARADVQRSHAALVLRRQEAASAQRHLDAAQAAWRAAAQRAERLDGDVLERELQARHALYQAALEDSHARQRLQRAQLEWLARAPAPGCIEAAAPVSPVALAQPLAGVATGGTRPATRPSRAELGWFVWRGEAWLERSDWAALPPATRRVALSFDAATLERLATEGPLADRLDRLLAEAHSRGLLVDWLLGEPTWVTPEGRPALLALLGRLRRFAFDGVNLDLERSQLPQWSGSQWDDGLVQTVHEVSRTVSWPVVLTTHHREFADTRLVERLQEAGLSEGIAMVYVSDPSRAEQILRPLLHGGLPLALAQSIEPELDAEESSARLGRAQALSRWQRLSAALASQPYFDGVWVQSWEAFIKARP